ncbi:MAG: phosphoribosyltransferase [Dehalococcoidia bacterium]
MSDPLDYVEQARQGELHRIVRENSGECYFQSGDGYHFVTPAGLHCTHFLRLSDAIRTRQTLDALAFWLRPELAASQGVLLDSWTIASVLLHALEGRSGQTLFDCLPGHPASLVGPCRAVLRSLFDRLGTKGKVTVLSSVSSSGTLQCKLRTLVDIARAPDVEVEFLSIYKFAGSDAAALCVLPEVPENYLGVQNCAHCKRDSVPLAIDPRLYYLRDRHEREVPIRKRHWEIGRRFIDKYGQVAEAFCCHVDDPNDGRHHALAIDVLRLSREATFVDAFRMTLAELDAGEADLIVVPPHAAGRALADLASRAIGAPVIETNDLRKGGLSANERVSIEQARRLLVVDDVVNSGSRLEEFNTSVREDWGGRFDRVSFAIGVARTESDDELSRITRSLTMHYPWQAHLAFAERVLLPRWDEKSCPWCKEYEYLSAASAKAPLPPDWLVGRLAQLSDTVSGLRSTPLLFPPGHARVLLGAGALAGPEGLSECPLLFSVATAIQMFKHDPDPQSRLDPGFPVGNVAGLKNLQNYSEGLMRMALLRLFRGREWGMTRQLRIVEFLRAVARRSSQRVLIGELLIAQARNAVIPFGEKDFTTIFASAFPALDVTVPRSVETP